MTSNLDNYSKFTELPELCPNDLTEGQTNVVVNKDQLCSPRNGDRKLSTCCVWYLVILLASFFGPPSVSGTAPIIDVVP